MFIQLINDGRVCWHNFRRFDLFRDTKQPLDTFFGLEKKEINDKITHIPEGWLSVNRYQISPLSSGAAVVAFQLLLHYAWLLRSTQMMTTFRSFFNPPLTLTRFRIDLPPRYFSLWPFILVVELRKNLFVLAIFQAAATSKIVNFMNFGDVQNYGLPLKISQKNLHTIMTYG